ncbi:MBL fold metallo-hydrolase [Sciscionella marina]|uniref:MBL fold metallo-hydrolase n=1 Tax=Sciscionella marina TaxID=508770 RepID=UPI0003637459|nr:MBL fold metallo-hydrolase [Sciscionella marina]
MHFLGHSTIRMRLGGHVVLSDPVLTATVGGLRRVIPPPDPRLWRDAELVLISHLHGDHLHLPSLRLLDPGVRIVVPRGAGEWLRHKGFGAVTELGVGERIRHGGLTVTGVRAVHSGHRWGPRCTAGPDAPALGHLLEADGERIYLAGDTDLYPDMAELAPVDTAALPVWGWGPNLGPGHLDPARAARAAGLLRARRAVPVHWGTLAVPLLARTARMRRLLVDPPRRFAAAVAEAGLSTLVLLTEPGAEVTG